MQSPYQASPRVPQLPPQVPPQPSPPVPWQYSDAISAGTVPVLHKRASGLHWPDGLSANERVMLGWIFSLINGQRTVAEITALLPRLRFEDVKSGLIFLKQLGALELIG